MPIKKWDLANEIFLEVFIESLLLIILILEHNFYERLFKHNF
jgi:hypothetical protein